MRHVNLEKVQADRPWDVLMHSALRWTRDLYVAVKGNMQTRSSLFRTLAILDLATSFWQVREKGETMNISRIRISDIFFFVYRILVLSDGGDSVYPCSGFRWRMVWLWKWTTTRSKLTRPPLRKRHRRTSTQKRLGRQSGVAKGKRWQK